MNLIKLHFILLAKGLPQKTFFLHTNTEVIANFSNLT